MAQPGGVDILFPIILDLCLPVEASSRSGSGYVYPTYLLTGIATLLKFI